MRVKKEDVLGVYLDEKLYCLTCVDEDVLGNADPEDLLLSREVETSDDMFFCDCEDHVGPRRVS
jgi:hypothetical protein